MGHPHSGDPDILPAVPAAVVEGTEAPQSDRDRDLPVAEAPAVSRKHGELDPDFDLRLAVLAAVREPKQTFTLEEIAEACGCCRQTIANIEDKALKKLRRGLSKAGVNPDDLNFTEHSFANKKPAVDSGL